MVDLFIDDIPVSVPRNTTILQACDSVGIDVPRFCFHERLLIAGNCRMCLVEVNQFPNKPIASCTFPVGKDMKVYTRTPLVKKAQESVLEFLLLNHPLDCPICDQGGECDLQDQAMLFGSDSGRFYEYKRGVEDKNCGPLVKTIMTRCIHCTRCIRFATEIGGISDLGTTGRGKKTEIGTYVQKLIRSELSGNIIDLCPVGALTSKPYAFTARSWELKSTESIDIFDGIGSNIIINTKGNEVMRILPKFNENINEEWITDKVRFSYDGLKKQRIFDPCFIYDFGWGPIRKEKAEWPEVLPEIAFALGKQDNSLAIVSGENVDFETISISKRLLNNLGSSDFYSESSQKGKRVNVDFSSSYLFNSSLPSLEEHDLCILININPRIDGPLINTRIRKSAVSNRMRVAFLGENLELSYNTTNLGFSKKSLIDLVEGRHPFCSEILKYENPVFIFGNNSFQLDLLNISSILRTKSFGLTRNPSVHFLSQDTSLVGSSDLGVSTDYSLQNLMNTKVLFLLNTVSFDFSKVSNCCFRIYIGPHGMEDAKQCDIVLPSLCFTEKQSSYINVTGALQKTFRALFGPGNSRNDWEIFAALYCVLGYDLPFSDVKTLRSFTSYINLSFLDTRQFSSENFEVCATRFIRNNSFNKGSSDFYLSNTISANSRVMMECSQNRLKTNYN